MERAILDHFQSELVKNYALLSLLNFVHIHKKGIDELFYANKGYAVKNFNIIMITLGDKKFMFEKNDWNGIITLYELNDVKTISWGRYSAFEFNDGSSAYTLHYIDDLISYHFSNPETYSISFTRDGNVGSLDSRYCNYKTDDFMTIMGKRYNMESVNKTFSINTKHGKMKLYIRFHPNGRLKMYETTVNYMKQGISYISDESGKFGITSYQNGKLHGYYYSTFNNTEGFYKNGIKVGFWKERGRIVNYDEKDEISDRVNNSGKDRIFFLFPIFIS